MGRIYSTGYIHITDEHNKQLFRDYIKDYDVAKSYFNETDFAKWAYHQMSCLREAMHLPNRICTVLSSKDGNEISIALFPKEPNGENYKVFYDEELQQVYIEV